MTSELTKADREFLLWLIRRSHLATPQAQSKALELVAKLSRG